MQTLEPAPEHDFDNRVRNRMASVPRQRQGSNMRPSIPTGRSLSTKRNKI